MRGSKDINHNLESDRLETIQERVFGRVKAYSETRGLGNRDGSVNSYAPANGKIDFNCSCKVN